MDPLRKFFCQLKKVVMKEIQGNTLIEVLASMTIISVSTGIALMIHTNVVQANRNQIKLKASLKLNELAIEAQKEKAFDDDEYNTEFFNIYKTINNYGSTSYLFEMNMIAKDKKGVFLAGRKMLVLKDETSMTK